MSDANLFRINSGQTKIFIYCLRKDLDGNKLFMEHKYTLNATITNNTNNEQMDFTLDENEVMSNKDTSEYF